MSKPKKAAEAETLPAAVADAAADGVAEQVATGDGAGQALPEVGALSVERTAPAIESQASALASVPAAKQESEDVVDAFVLCDGSLDGTTRYPAGSVVQGVPESLAEANRHWLDTHPAAVEHALNSGAAAVDYEQEA